jgi:ferritin-like metal-binding protein YciE
MKLTSLSDLYVNELQDMYNAEKQLTRALPKLAKAASTPELRSALEEHLEVTQTQLERLETILGNLGKKPGRNKCEAMQGLVSEGQEIVDMDGDDAVRDAGIIVAGQKVEHYEIASYGSLETFARLLGREEDASLLHTTLEEEREADQKLNQIAEGGLNQQALQGAAMGESDDEDTDEE